MDIKQFVNQKMAEITGKPELLNEYDKLGRFYHNRQHIESMVAEALRRKILTDDLFLAIVFHDIVYDPKRNDNEELSAYVFKTRFTSNRPQVEKAILATKHHKPRGTLQKHLCELDLMVLNGDLKTFIEFEYKIFKEYQFVDYSIYKDARIEVLKKLKVKKEFIDYVRTRVPNIGIYAGSFNPWHRGHFDILAKAEQIFDKVIIARGINPDKNNELDKLPDYVNIRQVDTYDGLLTDYMVGKQYPATLIRGLRNATDLQYELTQYRYLQDLMPQIKTVNLFCDREHEHISSSAIRSLWKLNKSASRYM